MARFHQHKLFLDALCMSSDWKAALQRHICDADTARAGIGPLLILLPRADRRWQAAYGLGLAVPLLGEADMEAARVIMRRLMWSLNEESGNFGWGIPEAMGCILANSSALAREYARIFLSYGYETGKDDNFIESALLRQGLYWGIGRLAQKNAPAARSALPYLAESLADASRPLCGMAAWAIQQLVAREPGSAFFDPPGKEEWQAVQDALDPGETKAGMERDSALFLEIFDGSAIVTLTVSTLLTQARAALQARIAERCSENCSCTI